MKRTLVKIGIENAMQFAGEYNLICEGKSKLSKRLRDHIVSEVRHAIKTQLLVVKDKATGQEVDNIIITEGK
jgi:hypothetical protein